MNKDRISYLLEKYLEDRLTPGEKSELHALAVLDNGLEVSEMIRERLEQEIRMAPNREEREADSQAHEEILARILSVDKTRPDRIQPLHTVPFYRKSWFAVACAALLILVLGIRKFYPPGVPDTQPLAAVDPKVPVGFTRSLILPDGSSVILKGGSTLSYPETFSGATREVTLTGEAYFDIEHIGGDRGQTLLPFIIHTGKVKTVVLGTSFNIRAYPDQRDIVVSVTKGKVRVEDDAGEVLAVLTKDQQVIYNAEGAEVLKTSTQITKATDWVKSDMEFDGVSFESIAQLLEKRYGVRIVFQNPELRPCLTVVSFSGTESLDNVLETLCLIRSATYTKNANDEILISGNGCE